MLILIWLLVAYILENKRPGLPFIFYLDLDRSIIESGLVLATLPIVRLPNEKVPGDVWCFLQLEKEIKESNRNIFFSFV
jgi:hypothetical protein